MPFRSKKQQRFMYATKPKGVDLKEWAEETDFDKLPEKVRKKKTKKKDKNDMMEFANTQQDDPASEVLTYASIYYQQIKTAKAKWHGKFDRDTYFAKEKYDQWITDPSSTNINEFLTPQNKANDILKSLINDPYVFVNYTDKPMVGTNYNSYFGSRKYNTPAGFYAYPIVELGVSTSEFAKDKPYLIVVRSDPEKTLVFSKYSEQDQIRDIKKLTEKFGNVPVSDRNVSNLPIERVWNYIWSLSQTNFSKLSTVWAYLGYNTLYDDGFSIIHPNEPRQAIFLTPKTGAEIIRIYRELF